MQDLPHFFNVYLFQAERLDILTRLGAAVLAGAAIDGSPRPSSFGCYDRTYLKEPNACDHIWTSADIVPLANSDCVDSQCRFSDHLPVWVEWEDL